MAKGFQDGFKKSKNVKPDVLVQELPPKIQAVPDGVNMMCPFCAVPHPISVGQNAACGTKLRVTAVQTVYPTRTVNKFGLKCLKCGNGGGEMIRFNEQYVHLAECMPSVKLLASAPTFSRAAQILWGAPRWLSALTEKWLGKVQEVREIDSEGKETGKTLGYFFLREVTKNGRTNPSPNTG